jgi:regulator of vacuolar morphogenesis
MDPSLIPSTDFEVLHNGWIQAFPHAPPPAPLPPKTFSIFGYSTSSDPTKIEERRRGLEQYLLALLHARDERWRRSKEWAMFLGIPETETKSISQASTTSGSSFGWSSSNNTLSDSSSFGAGSLFTAESWLEEHRSIQASCREVRSHIANKDKHAASGDISASQSAALQGKKALSQIVSRISSLDDWLKREERLVSALNNAGSGTKTPTGATQTTTALNILTGASNALLAKTGFNVFGSSNVDNSNVEEATLSSAEISRRGDLILQLKDEYDKLQKLLSFSSTASSITSKSAANASLVSNGSGSRPTSTASQANPAPLIPRSGRKFGTAPPRETEITRTLDNAGLVQLQQNTMNEQDEALDMLSTIIRRQQQIGIAIGNELDLQNRLLEDLDEGVDRVAENLKGAGKKLDSVSGRKKK